MRRGTVVAVCGHESDGGQALRDLLDVMDPRVPCVSGGRELFRRVRASRSRGEDVCVVPMTLGRDPELVADAARTLLGLTPAERAGTVLAEPFGTAEHLVGWLRAAATRVPDDRALLVTAPSGDPFADADLFRIARLVRQYGRHRTVEVALTGGDPDPAGGVRRCRALGAERVVLLPAAWAVPPVPDPAHCEIGGPLLTASATAGVLDARVGDAWHRRDRHGDDGLPRGLTAAHDHGHSHSHGPGGHGHGHGHDHGSGDHGHSHDPSQGPGGHDHGPGHHDHGPARHDHGPAHHDHGPGHHDHGPARHDHGPGHHDHGPAHHGRGHSHSHGRGHSHDHAAAGGHTQEALGAPASAAAPPASPASP
ncbi:sirohydrochlorin chelatase, partial [Streptomyces mayonensis]|uniref:sirohydrochlorin chelatase n=1 Tax=Streptomyces mayonensis TaxID=2750816 RepID=UPI0027E4135B